MTEPCESPGDVAETPPPITDDTSASGSAPSTPVADEAVQEVNNSCECKQTEDETENNDSIDQARLSVGESNKKKGLKRNVSFPSESCVKSYLEPPDPGAQRKAKKWTTQDLIQLYRYGCEKNGTKPLTKVLQQLQGIENTGERYEILSLKGEKLDMKICESLEEIFKMVQFRCVDLEASHLDDETAVALFDMVEYYESACKVNISFNKNISGRGWQACSRMIRKTPGLTFLDMRNCDCNERVIPLLGRSLRMGCFLTTLHMESTNISGRALVVLVAALKMNELLKELFLADNKLMPTDGIQLGNLLKYNHTLQLLDLRNNCLQDVGVGHICDGLYEQNLDTGLSTLVLWNNQITYQAMPAVSKALSQTENLETLNLGHNNITNEGIHLLKDGLLVSKSLLRLGLQATKISCEGAVALAEAVADSHRLLRIDLRENDIKTAGLMALSLALKVNETVTRLDLDKDTKRDSGMKDYAEQQKRLQEEIAKCLDRNRELAKAKAKIVQSKPKPVDEVQTQSKPEEVVPETAPEENVEKIESEEHVENVLLEQYEKIQRPGLLFIPDMSPLPLEQTLDSPHVCPVTPMISSPMGIPGLPTASPPAEVILSPQYVPAVRKKKIFTVSKVEIQSLISPTAMSVLPAASKIILSPSPLSDAGLGNCDNSVLPDDPEVAGDTSTSSKFTLLLADPNKMDGLDHYGMVKEESPKEVVKEKVFGESENVNEITANSEGARRAEEIVKNESLEDGAVCNAQEISGVSPENTMCNIENSSSTANVQNDTECIVKSDLSEPVIVNNQSQPSDRSCDSNDQSADSKPSQSVDTDDINQGVNKVNIVELSVVNGKPEADNSGSIPNDMDMNTENEQWTHVPSSEGKDSGGSSDPIKMEIGSPDFHTNMTLNGMTQELASALDSIETEKIQNKEICYENLSAPDEFERELDAMIANVTQSTNIPQMATNGKAQAQDLI